MLKKMTKKSAVVMSLVFGLLVTSVAPSALAVDRKCKNRNDRGRYTNVVYRDQYANRYYDDRDYDRRDRRDRRDRDRWDREDTTGKTVKRVGVGAGIGAVGGALLGGKKGALIGAGIGAAGGYIYHRKKVDDQRDRRWRWPF